jgi:hypothetical protein
LGFWEVVRAAARAADSPAACCRNGLGCDPLDLLVDLGLGHAVAPLEDRPQRHADRAVLRGSVSDLGQRVHRRVLPLHELAAVRLEDRLRQSFLPRTSAISAASPSRPGCAICWFPTFAASGTSAAVSASPLRLANFSLVSR